MYRFNQQQVVILLTQELYLNTTHVSVQFPAFSSVTFLPLNLNTTHVSVQLSKVKEVKKISLFKYNPCIGSMLYYPFAHCTNYSI